MILTRYGTPVWVVCSLLLAAATAAAIYWLWPVAIVPVALWAWVLWFFRDPERKPPHARNHFVSAADGHVTDVTPLGPESVLGCEGVQVGVFMSVFDVHVNRAPCDGTVRAITHKDGAYIDVRRQEGWERNEATTIVLDHTAGGRTWTVVFRQIAGFVARRIITDLSEGQAIERGRRVGMIRFGSRCELLVPSELVESVPVKPGQKVRAGETVLVITRPFDEAAHV